MKAGGNQQRDAVKLREFHGAGLDSFEAISNHFQHFIVADIFKFARFREEAGVGGINAVYISIPLAAFRF